MHLDMHRGFSTGEVRNKIFPDLARRVLAGIGVEAFPFAEGFKDEPARRILLNCRRAVPDDGVLLLVEYCLGGENPTVGKIVDVVMLTMTGGKERTVREHRELLTSAGFSLNETVPLFAGCHDSGSETGVRPLLTRGSKPGRDRDGAVRGKG